jgi:hypothetical protein
MAKGHVTPMVAMGGMVVALPTTLDVPALDQELQYQM